MTERDSEGSTGRHEASRRIRSTPVVGVAVLGCVALVATAGAPAQLRMTGDHGDASGPAGLLATGTRTESAQQQERDLAALLHNAVRMKAHRTLDIPVPAPATTGRTGLGTAVLTTAMAKLGAGEQARTAVAFALGHLGDPYEWGATGPDRWDCSGLTQAAYAAAGVRIPRVAADQAGIGVAVPLRSLLPGDLLFWAYDPSDPATIHHVALYLGNGLVVNAPKTGDVVRVAPLWLDGYAGAVRVTAGAAGGPTGIAAAPGATPTTGTTPSAGPARPARTGDTPRPKPSATTSGPPKGSPSPSQSGSPSPSASPSPSGSASPSPSVPTSPSASPPASPSAPVPSPSAGSPSLSPSLVSPVPPATGPSAPDPTPTAPACTPVAGPTPTAEQLRRAGFTAEQVEVIARLALGRTEEQAAADTCHTATEVATLLATTRTRLTLPTDAALVVYARGLGLVPATN